MRIRRWRFVLLALVAAIFGCGSDPSPESAPSDSAGAPPRPNVVLIVADDQGWGDLSLHGNTDLATPNIDSIARDGAQFDRFYVGPVCSPMRAELLTGRYHPRGGVHGTSAGSERLNLDERTFGQAFQDAGYATGAFGKWHNGSQPPYHPNYRGFDEFFGFTSGHWAHYFDPVLDHNQEIVHGEGFIIDDLTAHAMAFIEENRGGPFLCYVPYNTPHSPMQVPDRFYAKFDGATPAMHNRDPEKEDLPHLLAALAMVENIDWNVGRILEKLDELGLAENTIVVYLSDNGPNGWRWNGDMKGRKGSLDEGGLRGPSLWRWPGKIPEGRKIEQIAGAIDIGPTLTELVGIELASPHPLDGKSLKPLLMDAETDWPERELFAFRRGQISVRNQRYRLDAQGELFDIADDPGQRVDVAAEHPQITERLQASVARMAGEIAGYTDDDRPFLVGHAEFTWLPARDAVAEGGGIERSARPPNSSYFRHWTGTDGKITWDVEVLEAAEYEAQLYYATPGGKTGAEVELSFLGQTTTATVSEANDVPLIGPDDDRAKRGEAYTKDFKPMSLGKIRLEKGRAVLALRALKIPEGSEALEVHSLTLRR